MYPSMSSPNSRKRAAPGASPVVPIQQMQQPSYPTAQPDQGLRWDGGAVGSDFVDAGSRSVNPYGIISTPAQYGQGIPAAPSTALARRGMGQMSQALVPTTPRQAFDPNSGTWNSFGDESFLQPPNPMDDNDNIELLEERAARAKRDAQAKRKQIPPFVQKLSSFLDESKNTELIRWSDKGDSFVVLDEDEFAKTLIPELFKHNNYASFVRQLNMYGFHKRVGLSDNSMKASERKNKSPSEYYNPYFKRGHPNLLWLINKPKSGGSKKKGAKKEDGDMDSEDDGAVEETLSAQQPFITTNVGNRGAGISEVGPLQKKDLVQVKSQIDKLQQQQLAISQLIERLRRDHNQLVTQAIMFQSMHERHENSINAILNFLANVFRKSLEEQGGAQSVSDLLASIIPGAQMPQGSVVDLDDFVKRQAPDPATASTPKRQPRLLPPIPNQAKAMNAAASHAPQAPYQAAQPMGSITELFDTSPSDTTSPAYLHNELRTNPQEGMMKIIQDTNAGGTSGIDLPNVAAKTPVTMSHEQRSKMLNIMAGQSSSDSSSVPATAGAPPLRPSSSPIPPPHASSSRSPNMGLSPIFPSIQPPSLYEIRQTQAEMEALQQLQSDQAAKLDELSSILGPLSPSGRIPGVDESGNQTGYFDNIDYDQYLDPVALDDLHYDGNDFPGGGVSTGNIDGNDFNFSLDGPNDVATASAPHLATSGGLKSEGVPESAPGKDTPSPAGTEEILRNDLDTPERNSKRRRQF